MPLPTPEAIAFLINYERATARVCLALYFLGNCVHRRMPVNEEEIPGYMNACFLLADAFLDRAQYELKNG